MDLHVVAIRKEIIIFMSVVNDMKINVQGIFNTVNKPSTVFPKTPLSRPNRSKIQIKRYSIKIPLINDVSLFMQPTNHKTRCNPCTYVYAVTA